MQIDTMNHQADAIRYLRGNVSVQLETTPSPITEEDATYLTLLGFKPSFVDADYWVKYITGTRMK